MRERGGRVKRNELLVVPSATLAKLIHRFDPSDLRSDFDRWPELAREAWATDVPELGSAFTSSPSTIIITGMGGSGIVGELISDICTELQSKTRIVVLKDYHLPSWVAGQNAESAGMLVVGVSCSGNTEETLSVLNESARAGLRGFAFGSGGELKSFCERRSTEFTFTRTGALKVPRSSLPALFYPVLKFFTRSGIISLSDSEVEESFDALSRAKNECLNLQKSGDGNFALELAAKSASSVKNNGRNDTFHSNSGSSSTIPLVYTSRRTRAAGMRYRQSLNENSKLHGFDGQIPELCHNEIVGWDARVAKTLSRKRGKNAPLALPVLLRLEDDPDEIKTRFEIVEEIIKDAGVEPIIVPNQGRSYLARVMSMLYALDYSSYYTALLRNVDPIKTGSIDFLKTELKSRLNYLGRFSA